MSDTLDDLRAVLYVAAQVDGRSEDIGIGKNEIHPLAFRLKRETGEVLFGDASFRQGYRGVRSPDIREVLSFFEYDVDRRVLEPPEVEDPDEYFHLSYEDDQKKGEERFDQLDEDIQHSIRDAIEELFEDRLKFIKQENDKMNKEIRTAT